MAVWSAMCGSFADMMAAYAAITEQLGLGAQAKLLSDNARAVYASGLR